MVQQFTTPVINLYDLNSILELTWLKERKEIPASHLLTFTNAPRHVLPQQVDE